VNGDAECYQGDTRDVLDGRKTYRTEVSPRALGYPQRREHPWTFRSILASD